MPILLSVDESIDPFFSDICIDPSIQFRVANHCITEAVNTGLDFIPSILTHIYLTELLLAS